MGRLALIETRRSIALWFTPVMIALAWWGVRYYLDIPRPYWAATSAVIAGTAAAIGPVLTGVAAWMAGRARRHRLDDLLASTSRPAAGRELLAWAATLGYGLLPYAAIGGLLVATAGRRSIWGSSEGWVILAGAVALAAYGALGYTLGALIPHRLTAPLAAVGVFFGQNVLRVVDRIDRDLEWMNYLSPATGWNTLIWHGVLPRDAPVRVLFFAAVTCLSLAVLLLGLSRWRSPRAAIGAILALALAIGGAGGIAAAGSAARGYMPMIPYESVCSTDPFPVCVHPADGDTLPELSRRVNLVLAPLLGLPGMPIRAEATAPGEITRDGRLPADAIPFPGQSGPIYGAASIVQRVVIPPRTDLTKPLMYNSAQLALVEWLWARSGEGSNPRLGTCINRGMEAACAAAERFGRLSTEEQRAWLEANFAALRAGDIRGEEMP